jgi:hypothetical protein
MVEARVAQVELAAQVVVARLELSALYLGESNLDSQCCWLEQLRRR